MKVNTILSKNSIKLIIVNILKKSAHEKAIKAVTVAEIFFFALANTIAIVMNTKTKAQLIKPPIRNSFHNSDICIKNSIAYLLLLS